MNGISKETYQGYDTYSKLNTLFDYIHEIYNVSCQDDTALSDRIDSVQSEVTTLGKKFNRRKKVDTSLGIGSGFLGGIAGFFMKTFLFKG